jgi:hypothetical protein
MILDKLDEQRNLSQPESNFRFIIKNQINIFLKCRNEYWRQRYIIMWVQLGDEPTNGFYAAATKRYRLNTIISLHDEEG